jgi:hypothetical protein
MNRSLVTVLAASAAICVSSSAQAAPLIVGSSIDLAGYVQAIGSTTLNNATGLDFVSGPGGTASPGVAGTVATYGSGTGSLAGFTCSGANCGTISDIVNLVIGAQSITNFFNLTGGNNSFPIAFDLTGINTINRSDPNFLTFSASGNIRYDGFDPTPAIFLFSAQGTTATSFSATTIALSAVPEPATWAMMLIGLGAIGGTLRRRQKVTARIRFA